MSECLTLACASKASKSKTFPFVPSFFASQVHFLNTLRKHVDNLDSNFNAFIEDWL